MKLFFIFSIKNILTYTKVQDRETFYFNITKNYIPRLVKKIVNIFRCGIVI